MDRIVVVGTTGSGKSTFGARLSTLLDMPHVELDALFWDPRWTPVGEQEFEHSIRQALKGERWLVDGNYSRMRELIWPRATHVIWLDYSFPRTMAQLLSRTVRRAVRRETLFSGNQESLARSFFSRESILLWGVTSYRRRRREYRRVVQSDEYPDIEFVVLRHPGEAEQFLEIAAS